MSTHLTIYLHTSLYIEGEISTSSRGNIQHSTKEDTSTQDSPNTAK